MTRDIRWRILSLQIIAMFVLAACAGVGFWAHNFTQDQVRTQLTEQQISFPPANSAAIVALKNPTDISAMNQYGGQQMTTGYQAEAYANHFIAAHLKGIGTDPKTGISHPYSYWSGKALAVQATNPKQFAAYEATANTLFKGETLRSLLLNGYAFWFVGDLAFYAAIILTAGTVLVLFAFLFELAVVPRREGIVELKSKRSTAVAATGE